ncbi:MAG: transcription termination factor Rho [Elusimicrobia bacterium]|nr:transcription termination factor Rho [Elusimicrobiota bacterium]
MNEENVGGPAGQSGQGSQGGAAPGGGQPGGTSGSGGGQPSQTPGQQSQHGQNQGQPHGPHHGGGRRRRRRNRGGGGGGGQHHGQQQRQGGYGSQQYQGQNQNRNNGQSRPAQAPQTPQRSEIEVAFSAQTPVDPYEWLRLEKGSNDPSMRAMDLLAPIGKGTRGLIVAPPKAGKTTFLKQISNAVHAVDPKVRQYCLLVDERPEEVTDFKRSVPAEVWASSSDQTYQQHKKIAEDLMRTAIEKVVAGEDVFILLDSLTRLARVYNQFATGNRTMSGGLDSRAMETPRRFFGAARKIENGGSLTILATILVDTGSKMDDIIFQEFKGTGNMELVLYRQAAEMRIFPALKVRDSGTRKEEKLFTKEYLEGVYKLRRHLAGLGDLEAIKALTELMRTHKLNEKLLAALR